MDRAITNTAPTAGNTALNYSVILRPVKFDTSASVASRPAFWRMRLHRTLNSHREQYNADSSLSVSASDGLLAASGAADANGDALMPVRPDGSGGYLGWLPGVSTLTDQGGKLWVSPNGQFTYLPATNFSGWDSFQFAVWDKADNGFSPLATACINVENAAAAPWLLMPPTQWTNVDAPLEMSSENENNIAVASPYEEDIELKLELALDDGSLALATTAGLTFISGSGTSDASMSFTGTISAINAALDGLTYNPSTSFRGLATISATLTDEVHSSGLAEPLTDAAQTYIAVGGPVIIVPGTQSTNSAQPLLFSDWYGSSVYVVDPIANTEGLQIDLAIDNGTLSIAISDELTFLSGDGADDALMSFTGSLEAINAALAGLSYTPSANFVGEAT